MEQINFIPSDMLDLIPHFGGDRRELNLFLRQCEYVIDKFKGDEAQNTYVMHVVTGKLKDNAAALVSGRDDIENWEQLKELLNQYYGDHRSEELILLELDNLKIEEHETYADFHNRILLLKSTLMSKINKLTDATMKQAKTAMINEKSLNVFLYNLPLELVRTVRISKPSTLEQALCIVMEEVKFYEQYGAKNNWSDKEIRTIIRPPQTKFKFGVPQPGVYYRSNGPLFSLQAKQPSTNNQQFGSSQPQAAGSVFVATGFGTANTAGASGSGTQSVGLFNTKQPAQTFGNPTGTVSGFSFGSASKPEQAKGNLKEIEFNTENK